MCHVVSAKTGVVIAKICVALRFERSVNRRHVRITEVRISDVLLYAHVVVDLKLIETFFVL